MGFKKFALLVPLLLVMVFFSAEAQALVEVEGRYWFTDHHANLVLEDAGVLGTRINPEDDLGLETREDFPEGRVTLKLGNYRLRYAFASFSWDGERTLASPINFNGTTFGAGAFVRSEFDMDYHRLGFQYDFFDRLGNSIGVILEGKYFELDGALSSAALEEKESVSMPLPAVGLAFRLSLPALLSVSGEATGTSIGGNGFLVDAEGMLNFRPAPLVTLSGGYRILKIHFEKDDDELDLKMDGPFVALKVAF